MGQTARILSFSERNVVVLTSLLPKGGWLHSGAIDAELLGRLRRCILRGQFTDVYLKCKGDAQSCSVSLL